MHLYLKTTLFAIMLLVSACSAKTSPSPSGLAPQSPNVVPPPTENEGGVNGGGGGTLPANPISLVDVQEIIGRAKQTLNPFIKYQMRFYNLDPSLEQPYETKIYAGPVTIWDELQNTDIELLMDKPCHDLYGNETDGSVHASWPNAICISAFRIAPKLIIERAPVEIYALILHELSHRLGTTEPEARAFQKDAAYYLSSDDAMNKETAKTFATNAQAASENLSTQLYQLQDSLNNNKSDQEVLTAMNAVSKSLGDFEYATVSIPFSVFNATEHDYYFLESDRLMVAQWWLLSVADPKGQGYWQDQLDKIFAGADSISEKELHSRDSGDTLNSVYEDEPVHRIHNRKDFQELVNSFVRMFQVTNQAIRNLWLNVQMGPMPILEKTNPWQAFVGTFDVVARSCPDQNKTISIIGYKIAPAGDASNQLELVELWQNGYGSMGELYDGASVPSGQTAVDIGGDTDRASRTAATGDRWGESFDQNTIELSKLPDGYLLTKTNYDSRMTGIGSWSRVTSACTFKLRLSTR